MRLELGRRTRAALRFIQRRLERYYALESAPDVTLFASPGAEGEREVLLVHDVGSVIEMALRVPADDPRAGANDTWLQLVEGVSHFVYLAERVRRDLPATQLELELQAEVDKFVLLAFDAQRGAEPNRHRVRDLHERLFEHAAFIDPPDTEAGARYRLASRLAAGFVGRLAAHRVRDARAILREFYRAGQTEKIALARAA